MICGMIWIDHRTAPDCQLRTGADDAPIVPNTFSNAAFGYMIARGCGPRALRSPPPAAASASLVQE
jgi:hypothetical protein